MRQLKLIREFMKGNLFRYLGSILAVIVTVTVGFVSPLVLEETIDGVIGQKRPLHIPGALGAWVEQLGGRDFLIHHLWIMALAILALNLISCLFGYLRGRWSAEASESIAENMRNRLYRHLQTLSYDYHVKAETGDLIQRCTSDVETIRRFLSSQVVELFRSVLMLVIALVIMLSMNVKMTLVSMILVPPLFAFAWLFFSWVRRWFKESDEAEGRMSAVLQENLTGVRVVRAFDKEQSEIDRFESANDLLTRMQLHVGHISSLMSPLTYVIINLAIVALLYVGSIEINVGGMASGDVIALVNYMNQILVELVKLANLIVQVSKALACAGRVQAVLDTEPGMEFPAALKGEAPADKAGDAVRFDHVSLTYAGAGAPSLTDISFTAKRGQTIGVIGGTGSGKSSLINLIPRFYDATEGTVEILGRPAQEYPRAALRGSVAVVMQKAQLFGGTIRSNLLWGNKNAADADLWAALETAQAADFVRAKPLGLDEPVEQGGRNLSGGQKQRLTIARALVGKPEILILDDSASALDYATDAALRKALAALPGDLTVFIVSQRAASLQHADQIIVLDDGRMVGLGRHADLLKTCPVYEEIYASQFKKGDAQK